MSCTVTMDLKRLKLLFCMSADLLQPFYLGHGHPSLLTGVKVMHKFYP